MMQRGDVDGRSEWLALPAGVAAPSSSLPARPPRPATRACHGLGETGRVAWRWPGRPRMTVPDLAGLHGLPPGTGVATQGCDGAL